MHFVTAKCRNAYKSGTKQTTNMAKETEVRTKLDDVNDTLTSMEQKVEHNKKMIMWAGIGVAAVVAVALIYIFAIRRPGQQKDATNFGLANNAVMEMNMKNSQGLLSTDSLRNAELDKVIKLYEAAAQGSYAGANNAKLMCAVYLYQKGEYQKSLDYLKDYDRKESVIGCTSKCLEGDCLVNLDKFNEAVACYQEAAKIADGNPMLVPYAMLKEASVQRQLKNYSAEAAIYENLIANYPKYGQENGIDFEKYLARAKASK